jgi:DMSO/TMAO reductase YedYZ molybdopterin-dependent catalytic subunit
MDPVRDEPKDARAYGRRTFLGVTALGLSSLLWGKPVWEALSNPLVQALPPSLVPSGWRIYTVASSMPTFEPGSWRLRIEGLVDRPQTLTYSDLRSLPRAEQVSTFHCVTGWVVRDVHWGGVRFHDLLREAKPLPQAQALRFVSAEQPYDDYLELKQVALPDVMLAYEMDGNPLRREHGAPVRVVIPEMYGYKNTKWVEQIELVGQSAEGYWEQRGYDVDAWVGRSNQGFFG